MKKFIALGFSCLIAQGAMAQAPVQKPLPVLPAGCEDQINSNGLFCSARVITGSKVTVTFAAVVNKDTVGAPAVYAPSFPTIDSLLGRYLDVASWPAYADLSSQKAIEFDAAKGSINYGPVVGADGVAIPGSVRQGYKYKLKVQGIPLLKQSVEGLTYNTRVTPYTGALGSLEFQAIVTGLPADVKVTPAGVKSQVGSIHALECDPALLSFCDDSKWLIVYETTVEPATTFAMNIAADTIAAGIEDLLVGMLHQEDAAN